ncbi:hypothetical protein LINPERPRIM_LOCUS20639 [Linum perenne]
MCLERLTRLPIF